MDPNATVRAIREAKAAGNWREAARLRKALGEWLAKGGFPPTEKY
jgi:hypothetical protein